jgi:hypothetical protein
MKIKLNQAAIKKMQDDADRKAQDVIRGVNSDMSGGEVDSIHTELVKRLKAAGVEPNESEVHKYAQSISEGSLH